MKNNSRRKGILVVILFILLMIGPVLYAWFNEYREAHAKGTPAMLPAPPTTK